MADKHSNAPAIAVFDKADKFLGLRVRAAEGDFIAVGTGIRSTLQSSSIDAAMLAMIRAFSMARQAVDLLGDFLAVPVPAAAVVNAADLPAVSDGSSNPSTPPGNVDPMAQKIYLHGGNAQLPEAGPALSPAQCDEVDKWIGGGNRGLQYRSPTAGLVRVPSTVATYNTDGPMGRDTVLNVGVRGWSVFYRAKVNSTLFAMRMTKGTKVMIFQGPANGKAPMQRVTGAGGGWSADGAVYTVANGQTTGVDSLKLKWTTKAERIIEIRACADGSAPGGAWGDFYTDAGGVITPVLPTQERWIAVFDSWGELNPMRSVLDYLAMYFGNMVNITSAPVGGTGYTKGAGDGSAAGEVWGAVDDKKPTFLQRLKLDLKGGRYKRAVFFGGQNDAASSQMAGENLRKFVRGFKALHPECEEITVVGSNGSLAQLNSGQIEITEGYLLDAVKDEQLVGFVPLQTHVDGPLLTGNLTSGGDFDSTNGARSMAGSTSIYMGGVDGHDKDHPTPEGSRAVARRIAGDMVARWRRKVGV